MGITWSAQPLGAHKVVLLVANVIIPSRGGELQTVLIFSIAGLTVSPGCEGLILKSSAVQPIPNTLLFPIRASNPDWVDTFSLFEIVIDGLGGD